MGAVRDANQRCAAGAECARLSPSRRRVRRCSLWQARTSRELPVRAAVTEASAASEVGSNAPWKSATSPSCRATAAALPRIAIDDTLRVCLLVRDGDPDFYERAAVRWDRCRAQLRLWAEHAIA